MSSNEEGRMAKYSLNVDPDVEHELTDSEVADLRAFGFEVFEVKQTSAKNAQGNQGNDKKEG